MHRLRLIGFAIVSLVLVASAQAQHLGSRQQWQPQTESDPRLQQPVHLEIIGRAALTGLPLLSAKTGVSLTVAPEDLSTVGERKFTVIAKGCTLKAIMVQLCEALRECHWDVESGGKGPGYLLHRNAGVEEAAKAERKAGQPSPVEGEQREARQARLEAARAALKMTAEELKELEKTEPVLARVVREPRTRTLMEGICSLSQDDLTGFVSKGGSGGLYGELPAAMQKAADLLLARYVEDFRQKAAQSPEGESDEWSGPRLARLERAVRLWREESRAPSDGEVALRVRLLDNGCAYNGNISLGVSFGLESDTYGVEEPVIPARYVSAEGSGYARHWVGVLQAAGVPSEAAAWEILKGSEREASLRAREQLEARRKGEWDVPNDPDLLRTVKLARGWTEPVEWEQSLAEQTGMSVVADHFSGGGRPVTEQMAAGLPLWHALYLLCEDGIGEKQMEWRKVGGCLVLHDLRWRQRVREEVPESLVLAYREKLSTQGAFTLDDLAAFASHLSGFTMLPRDLRRAGLNEAAHARWSLGFYRSLSSAQLAQARSEAGLPYSDMTAGQQRQVAEAVKRRAAGVSAGDLRRAGFRIVEEKREERTGDDKRALRTTTHFRLEFPKDSWEEAVSLTSLPK
jgi:hypothetical protein